MSNRVRSLSGLAALRRALRASAVVLCALAAAPCWAAAGGPHLVVAADPLGLLLAGLSANVEYGDRWAVYARTRLLSLGLGTNLVGDSWGTRASVSGGAGVRRYLASGGLSGPFLGGGLEYAHLAQRRSENNGTDDMTWTTTIHALVPQIEIGYRWARESGMSVAVAAQSGYGVVLARRERFVAVGREPFAEDHATTDRARGPNELVGTVVLEIGWFVNR